MKMMPVPEEQEPIMIDVLVDGKSTQRKLVGYKSQDEILGYPFGLQTPMPPQRYVPVPEVFEGEIIRYDITGAIFITKVSIPQ